MSFSPMTQEDVAVCPHSVNIFLEFTAFSATLHFRVRLIQEKFISYLELLVVI